MTTLIWFSLLLTHHNAGVLGSLASSDIPASGYLILSITSVAFLFQVMFVSTRLRFGPARKLLATAAVLLFLTGLASLLFGAISGPPTCVRPPPTPLCVQKEFRIGRGILGMVFAMLTLVFATFRRKVDGRWEVEFITMIGIGKRGQEGVVGYFHLQPRQESVSRRPSTDSIPH